MRLNIAETKSEMARWIPFLEKKSHKFFDIEEIPIYIANQPEISKYNITSNGIDFEEETDTVLLRMNFNLGNETIKHTRTMYTLATLLS